MEIKSVTLSPEHEKAWNDTKTALIWHAPAFSHILYTLLKNSDTLDSKRQPLGAIFTDDPAIPTAATDGSNLIFNVAGFFRFNLNQRLFITAHEIMHNILGHCEQLYTLHMRGKITYPDGVTLDYDSDEMNCSQDYVINAILTESDIGEFPTVNGKPFGLLDTTIATSKDSSMDVYRKRFKKKPPPPPGQKPNDKPGDGKGNPNKGAPGGFDQLLPPGVTVGKDPQSAVAGRNEAEWATEIASAMSVARAMGNLPLSLEKALGKLLEPKVDWAEQIKTWFARKVGSGTFDWRRPDRRLITREIYTPGRSGVAARCIVVGCDTSGSVQGELDMFMTEMAGILEDIRPEQLIIIWCDAKVQRVDEADDSDDLNHIRCKGAPGGGGTSFIPVFDKIAEMGLHPDALIYLTDGEGTFPAVAPDYPVLWGNIKPTTKYPWGDVVEIPKQAQAA